MRHMYLLNLVLLLALTENILMITVCRPGEIRRGRKCVDDDECESDPPICGRNATCFNTVGSYYCQCHEGFTPPSPHNFTQEDGIKCEDINECLVGSDDCGPNTTCVNTEGGYYCTCATGYISSNRKDIFNSGQGVQCTDRDECNDPSFCGKHASCHNTVGGFYCICEAGFRLKSGRTIFNDTSELCESFTTAALLSYKGLDESLNCCFDHLETQQKQTYEINSKVVTATFSNTETTNIKKPIKLTFSHLEKKNEKHMCVFWDPELDGGAWSTLGCSTVSSRADQTVCSCNKLGSFAVLTVLCDTGVCRSTLNFCTLDNKP